MSSERPDIVYSSDPMPAPDEGADAPARPRPSPVRSILGLLLAFAAGLLAARYLPAWPSRAADPVRAFLLVEPRRRPLFSEPYDDGTTRAQLLNRQAFLVTSPDVLAEALDTAELRGLPEIQASPDPERWLRQNLRVVIREDESILEISMVGAPTRERAETVNAVVNAYLSRQKVWTDEAVEKDLQLLREEEVHFSREFESLSKLCNESKEPSEVLRSRLALTRDFLERIVRRREELDMELRRGLRIRVIGRARPGRTQ